MIDSYVDERIADAQLALGQKDAALASYKAATDAGRSLVPLLALREKVAQVLTASAKPQDALAQYEAILAVAKNDPYRATIEFRAAQTMIDGGANELGLDRMQKVFDTYPTTPEAYHAMKLLLDAKRDVDDYQRGQVSYNYGDYQDAIDFYTAIPRNMHSQPYQPIYSYWLVEPIVKSVTRRLLTSPSRLLSTATKLTRCLVRLCWSKGAPNF